MNRSDELSDGFFGEDLCSVPIHPGNFFFPGPGVVRWEEDGRRSEEHEPQAPGGRPGAPGGGGTIFRYRSGLDVDDDVVPPGVSPPPAKDQRRRERKKDGRKER